MMIKFSVLVLALAASAAVSAAALADPVLGTTAPISSGLQTPPHSKHAKKHDVNGVGGAGSGSLKARVTQPAGGK